jgi:hypothetical protein
MPVEERLELVAAIRADRLDPKRELLHDVVDRAFLGMSLVDLQCAHSRRIVDRRVLISAHRATAFPLQSQELDVHLDVMARDLFLVAVRVYRSPPHTIR